MNTRPSHPQAEPYLRSPQRGGGHTPGPAPQPFGSLRGLRGAAKLANTPHGRLILACVVTSALTITLFLGNHFGKTTVHGNLIMINSGARDTIECNHGILKLDGAHNTYT